MKRLIAFVMLLVCMFTLVACSDNSNNSNNGSEKSVTVNIQDVKKQILEKIDIVDPMDMTTERACVQYYLDAADVKDTACVIAMGGAFPEEIIMIEAVDADAAERVAEKLSAKLKDLLNQSANYDADTNALLQECSVVVDGNYVTLFIHAEHAQMREIFNAAKK